MFVAGCHFEQPAVHVPTYHSLQMELIMASTEINSHTYFRQLKLILLNIYLPEYYIPRLLFLPSEWYSVPTY